MIISTALGNVHNKNLFEKPLDSAFFGNYSCYFDLIHYHADILILCIFLIVATELILGIIY